MTSHSFVSHSFFLITITTASAACLILPLLASATPVSSEVSALGYLQRFGFINESSNGSSAALISGESFTAAIKEFQRFSQINETGKLDAQTLAMMNAPRCGNKDKGHLHDGRRSKRYALQGSKWKRMDLTYRITVYPRKLKKSLVDREIARAFKVWSDITPLNFIYKKEGKVHIDIRFVVSEHGDGDPFDGPGNTLAHAYFPQYGGDAHFDDEEYWTVDSYSGTNLFQVAAHELGHSLGLGHSSVRESLMAPFYQRYKPNFVLHKDDVLGIQALYGQRTSPPNPLPDAIPDQPAPAPRPRFPSGGNPVIPRVPELPASPSPGSPDGAGPDLCQDGKIDAVTRTADGSTYVFKGDYYFKVEANGLADGYPRKISTDWDGLPGNLDAALTWSDGKSFFFKGSKYWKFSDRKMASGYPKEISVGFAGIPNNIDAAFVWSGNGKTYFFKGDQYWRFDSRADPPVSNRYPKPLKNWVGLPNSVDAAFRWQNGLTYFFKGSKYYRFNDAEFEVDSKAKPPFPRQTSVWWFDCKSAQANPLGLSSDLRASIYVGNNSASASAHPQPHASTEEPMTISPAGYSSHPLSVVDKEALRDVEFVSSPVLAGHSNSGEFYKTHEANEYAHSYASHLHQWSNWQLMFAATLVTLFRILAL